MFVTIAVLPSSFAFNSEEATSINGSSPSGQCPSVHAADGGKSNCTTPACSILFDGHTPILNELDGDMWANEMLTFQTRGGNIRMEIMFDFTNTRNFVAVERVEVVLFNCPEWGIGINEITFLEAASATSSRATTFFSVSDFSCYSPVRLCLRRRTELPVVSLRFRTHPSARWVHLAEVGFYSNNSCSFEEAVVHTPVPLETTTHATVPPETTGKRGYNHAKSGHNSQSEANISVP